MPQRVQRRSSGRQPKQRGHHNRRPGGDIASAESGAREQVDADNNYAVFSLPHSKLVPSTQMQWRSTAILRATATLAFFIPIRLERRMPHAFSGDHFFVRR